MFGLRVGTRADFGVNPEYDGEVFADAGVSRGRGRFLQHDADRKRDEFYCDGNTSEWRFTALDAGRGRNGRKDIRVSREFCVHARICVQDGTASDE